MRPCVYASSGRWCWSNKDLFEGYLVPWTYYCHFSFLRFLLCLRTPLHRNEPTTFLWCSIVWMVNSEHSIWKRRKKKWLVPSGRVCKGDSWLLAWGNLYECCWRTPFEYSYIPVFRESFFAPFTQRNRRKVKLWPTCCSWWSAICLHLVLISFSLLLIWWIICKCMRYFALIMHKRVLIEVELVLDFILKQKLCNNNSYRGSTNGGLRRQHGTMQAPNSVWRWAVCHVIVSDINISEMSRRWMQLPFRHFYSLFSWAIVISNAQTRTQPLSEIWRAPHTMHISQFAAFARHHEWAILMTTLIKMPDWYVVSVL